MAILLVLSSVTAAAQDATARRVSIGVAAGAATPFHADDDFLATSWQADVRLETTRHFGFSVFLEEWRHTDKEVFTDQTIFGPSGPVGRLDRAERRTAHRTQMVGWSLLAKGRVGRAILSGGGGISYLLYSRHFDQAMSGCVPASACSNFSQHFDNDSFAAQGQAGVDVPITSRVSVMAQVRLLVPLRDPGFGHDSFLGGIRFRF